MTYQLGGTFTSKKFAGKVVVLNTGCPYTLFRAFARDEKTGKFREVLGCSREEGDLWVQGEFEGAWITHTHETKDEASAQGWKAYRWMNRRAA